MPDREEKPVVWVASTRTDLQAMPKPVRLGIGVALYQAQLGLKHRAAKPLTGFGGASVVEIVENYDTNTYRAVYTVRFEEAVYVLHIFQKKSVRGIETGRRDLALVQERLRQATELHRQHQERQGEAE